MTVKKQTNFFLFFIIFLTSFCLGVFYADKIKKTFVKNTHKTEKKDELSLKKYHQVYSIIKKNYFDIGEVETSKLVDSTVAGLVSGLGDKHSEYLTTEDFKTFTEQIQGDFEGIGAYIEQHPLGVEVKQLIEGSPAFSGGILEHDVITTVNGESIEGLTATKAVQKIKGPSGSTVSLGILRKGEIDVITKDIIRKKVHIPSLKTEELTDDIGYIGLFTYGEKSYEEFLEALENYKNKKGIIIDLRNNGGGLLQESVQIISHLLPEKSVILKTKQKGVGYEQVYEAHNVDFIYNGKIVVLVNQFSASASEITAGALKDHGKAIIVGRKTYGKGSVQTQFILEDKSMLKLTIAKWLTPSGHSIDKQGIEPDVFIDISKEDIANQKDAQKDMAIEVLQKMFTEKRRSEIIAEYKKPEKTEEEKQAEVLSGSISQPIKK